MGNNMSAYTTISSFSRALDATAAASPSLSSLSLSHKFFFRPCVEKIAPILVGMPEIPIAKTPTHLRCEDSQVCCTEHWRNAKGLSFSPERVRQRARRREYREPLRMISSTWDSPCCARSVTSFPEANMRVSSSTAVRGPATSGRYGVQARIS